MNRLRFHILAFTITRIILNTSYRMVYPFLPVFGRGLGVDLQMLSLALMFRSLMGVFGPFLASMGDRRGRKQGMLFGLSLFIAGLAIVILMPTFTGFILALGCSMLGKYVFDPSMQAFIGDHVQYQQRGLIMAVTEIGWSLSFIIGVPLMGFIIVKWGWGGPFPVLLMAGVVVFGILAWLIPGDKKATHLSSTTLSNIRTILTNPTTLYGLSFSLLAIIANEVINLVFGVWIEDSFGVIIAALGVASIVIGFSELGGETLVGGLTDRLGKPRSVAIGLIANSLAALSLPFLGKDLVGALIGLFFFYITFEFTLVSSMPLMTEIMPTARATMMAMNVASHSLGRALGALIASPLYSFHILPGALSGILVSALAAVVFNLLALTMILKLQQKLKIQVQGIDLSQ